MGIQIDVSPARVTWWLALAVLCLTVANAAAHLGDAHLPREGLIGQAQSSFVRLFNVDYEANIPTWFSASGLLFCALLLAVIASSETIRRGPFAPHWAVLAVVFVGLSIDEAALIHEMGTRAMGLLFSAGGFLYYSWVIPGLLAVTLFGLAYLPFLLHLPRPTKSLIIAAGAVFFSGAIGMEAFGGWWNWSFGTEGVSYLVIVGIEELLEMVGVVILIYALLDFIARQMGTVVLRVAAADPARSLEGKHRQPHGSRGA